MILLSRARRQAQQAHRQRRWAEGRARARLVTACCTVQAHGLPVAQVTRRLALSERTVRHWRHISCALNCACRGRPPRPATREERNRVYHFLRERGTQTPLVAVQAAFPQLRRADLSDLVRRYRRLGRRKRERLQSRLEWRRPGAVWAADFKERREPIEGRYGWILSIKDLASRFQLTWQPVAEATAEVVQNTYARLFEEHGPPLVLKSDNGSQFKADETKRMLAAHHVVPLFSPRRHPQYNGGVERANGQLSGYQEALAEFHGRPRAPRCDDAQGAQRLANELARPNGWRGPTAGQLWLNRAPLRACERAGFLASVAQGRAAHRARWDFAPDAALTHEQASAVDRRAVRDALVAHDLLRIHPRRKPRAAHPEVGAPAPPNPIDGAQAALATIYNETAPHPHGAGILESVQNHAPPVVGAATELSAPVRCELHSVSEEVKSSTNKLSASGKD